MSPIPETSQIEFLPRTVPRSLHQPRPPATFAILLLSVSVRPPYGLCFLFHPELQRLVIQFAHHNSQMLQVFAHQPQVIRPWSSLSSFSPSPTLHSTRQPSPSTPASQHDPASRTRTPFRNSESKRLPQHRVLHGCCQDVTMDPCPCQNVRHHVWSRYAKRCLDVSTRQVLCCT